MALNINGTTGISGVDGSASAPVLKGTDANTGVSFGNDIIDLNTGGSSRFKIGAAGQLGVAGANYGSSGQALVSQGASAAPQWATVGGGKVLQVVEGASTSQTSVSTTTYSDIGLAVDITPQANSKVLVLVNFQHNMNSNQEEGFGIKLLRGSTQLAASASQAEWYAYTASSGQFQNRATFNFLDGNPGGNGSTALTYKIQAATYASRTVEFMVNGSRSTIILIEIGA